MEELKLEVRKLDRRETKGTTCCLETPCTGGILDGCAATVDACTPCTLEILDVLKQTCFEGCEI
jgi:hypothetical protein